MLITFRKELIAVSYYFRRGRRLEWEPSKRKSTLGALSARNNSKLLQRNFAPPFYGYYRDNKMCVYYMIPLCQAKRFESK